MLTKQLLNPDRVRKIAGSFAYIEYRFLRSGFRESLSRHELRLYFFLVLVADCEGISYYSYDHICRRIDLILDEYLQAGGGLIDKDLLAFDGFFFQIQFLPEKPLLPPNSTQEPVVSAVQALYRQWSVNRDEQQS